MKKLITFVDHVGRIIIGEEVAEKSTESRLMVKNPMICNLIPPQQEGQPTQLSLLPYCFWELIDVSKHDDWEIGFVRDHITTCTSMPADDMNNIHASVINRYQTMCDNVRGIKHRPQPTPVAEEKSAENTNTVSVE